MSGDDFEAEALSKVTSSQVSRAFGEDNRARLLNSYLAQHGPITCSNAWCHVYRLLLWIDRTIALAHCYESDKCQPGRTWYARSLAFHVWVAERLRTAPSRLGEDIDWLFKAAVKDLAAKTLVDRLPSYDSQRKPYADLSLPEPGEDPEMVGIVRDVIGVYFASEPKQEDFRDLTRRIYAHVTQENKRKNLVGEGFEDVLAMVLRQTKPAIDVRTRPVLHTIPGFHPPRGKDKVKKVDLALIEANVRTLISAKWSIRADREEQFFSDFENYSALESLGQNFNYVLITNEFDSARLKAACERRRQNAHLFSEVVHIQPDAVLVAYGDASSESFLAVRQHLSSGRLKSLETWLNLLGAKESN